MSTTTNKLFAFLAWAQLITSLLLASAIVWGYVRYQPSLRQFIQSVAASIGAVSNVVLRTAETIETRRDLLEQAGQMVVATRSLVNELRVAAESQAKMGPQYADGLRSASKAAGKLGGSLDSMGDGLVRLSLPAGIRMEGMKPVFVMANPLAYKGQELKDGARDIKMVGESLAGISDALSRDAKNVTAAFVVTTEQALKVLVEIEKTLAQLRSQDLPKAMADLKTTSENLRNIGAQIDMVGNAGLLFLVVGLLLAGWCFLHSLAALMLAKTGQLAHV